MERRKLTSLLVNLIVASFCTNSRWPQIADFLLATARRSQLQPLDEAPIFAERDDDDDRRIQRGRRRVKRPFLEAHILNKRLDADQDAHPSECKRQNVANERDDRL